MIRPVSRGPAPKGSRLGDAAPTSCENPSEMANGYPAHQQGTTERTPSGRRVAESGFPNNYQSKSTVQAMPCRTPERE